LSGITSFVPVLRTLPLKRKAMAKDVSGNTVLFDASSLSIIVNSFMKELTKGEGRNL